MAGEDPDYIARMHRLPCCARDAGPCDGPIQAHHATYDRGISMRQHDYLAMPLCMGHHDDFHAGRGAFRGWTKEARRAWQAARVEETVMRLQPCEYAIPF